MSEVTRYEASIALVPGDHLAPRSRHSLVLASDYDANDQRWRQFVVEICQQRDALAQQLAQVTKERDSQIELVTHLRIELAAVKEVL